MELKVWQGGRASFERLRANNMLESGKVYFVGNSESSAEGLFSSSKGVIFVGIGLASAVQFGTFEEGEDLTEVIERIKSEIETLKKQADSVSQRLADEIRTNTEIFAQIDEALTNKAEQSQVDEIEKAVESKAEQTQVDAIESVVLVHVDQIDALQKNKAEQTQVDAIESVVLVHVDQIDALQKNKAEQTQVDAIESVVLVHVDQIDALQKNKAEQTQAITEMQSGKADRSELANYETEGIPESEILSICKL